MSRGKSYCFKSPEVSGTGTRDEDASFEPLHWFCESLKTGSVHPRVIFDAELEYTGNDGAVRCKACGLEKPYCTLDEPFIIHSKERPDCSFALSMKQLSNVSTSSTTTVRNTSISNEHGNSSKRQKLETKDSKISNNLIQSDLLNHMRRRTFSHWPHRTTLLTAQMIEAGFFYCNVGDRVICIYCNLICHQWTPHTDDPCEVHKTLSPNCTYVKAKLIRAAASSILILNESSTDANANNHLLASNTHDPFRSNEIRSTAVCNPTYAETPERVASFSTWPNENLPLVDDLVRAGFFYTGTKTTVTCFYCNGSLPNWGPNDKPLIEHARWYPHCAYVKQLYEDELYENPVESKRAQQKRARANELTKKAESDFTMHSNLPANKPDLVILDGSSLSRFVDARLDLPISQAVLDKNFKLLIVKQCWKNQLTLKRRDFESACDLYIACLILQQQIECIYDKKKHIVKLTSETNRIYEKEKKDGNAANFREDREKTIEREKSLVYWPHPLPSRKQMLISGWQFDRTKGEDHTVCMHCGAENHNWKADDDPLLIHRMRLSHCPFLLSSHPMPLSSVPITRLAQFYTPEKISADIVQPNSPLILPSDSKYALPTQRSNTYHTFPEKIKPEHADALALSGFYYVGIGTILRCYYCGEHSNDFHQCPSNEINTKHHERFPHCRFAQFSPRGETRVTNAAGICEWCLIERSELLISPCSHPVVCKSCAQWTSICPICSKEAENYSVLYK